MSEHYLKTITPPPDESLKQLPSREHLRRLIDTCGLDSELRAVLRVVLDLQWPATMGPDDRPGQQAVKTKYDAYKSLANIRRETARASLRLLHKLGYVHLTEFSYQAPVVQPHWGKLVGVEASSCRVEASTQKAEASSGILEASRAKVEASSPVDPETWRPPDLGVEASSESGEELDQVSLAIIRVGNHIANRLTKAIEDGFARLEQALLKRSGVEASSQNLEASGGLQPSEASSPLLINQSINQSDSLIDLSKTIESAPVEASTPPEASRPRRKERGNFCWSHELRSIRADKLRDPAHVDRMLAYVRSQGYWNYPGDDRLLFFATVVESLKLAKKLGIEPGGILTNKIRDREEKPASDESIRDARASLERAAQRAREPTRSTLAEVAASKQRELLAAGVGYRRDLPDPIAVSSLMGAVRDG